MGACRIFCLFFWSTRTSATIIKCYKYHTMYYFPGLFLYSYFRTKSTSLVAPHQRRLRNWNDHSSLKLQTRKTASFLLPNLAINWSPLSRIPPTPSTCSLLPIAYIYLIDTSPYPGIRLLLHHNNVVLGAVSTIFRDWFTAVVYDGNRAPNACFPSVRGAPSPPPNWKLPSLESLVKSTFHFLRNKVVHSEINSWAFRAIGRVLRACILHGRNNVTQNREIVIGTQ